MAFHAFAVHRFLKEVWERRHRTWPECLEMEIYFLIPSPVSLVTLLSTQKCVSGVCLTSWSTVQSVKAACGFEMSAAVVFLPRLRFSLVMKTLIPRAGVWSLSHPFLTEIPISPLSCHCRSNSRLSNVRMSCLCSEAKPQSWQSHSPTAGTQIWVWPSQPILAFVAGSGEVLGGQLHFDKMGRPEKQQMQEGWHGEREGWLWKAVVATCGMCCGGCSFLLLRAVTAKWLSGCFGTPCPAHHTLHSYSHIQHSRLCLKLFTSPHCGVWRDGELPCFLNEVGYPEV